ncbi:sensor histidine kinase [Martelella radicis]|uniref:histidine kinase n=1 Tax=Martelella radicis TaxID=1397476 RepID=A0A7W6KK85_9HYPH|nr:HAMP domain-containing sensor histidine kinase [Martelella radicis]MBB4122853.1 signal transduction histidine kinase [Martelella radicis]
MSSHWRPSLAFVLGGALSGTLFLSFCGLVVFRYLGPAIGFREAAILLGSLIALATGFLGWLLVRLLMRPILALRSYAAAARNPGAEHPALPSRFGTNELKDTALSIVEMAEALREHESAIRSHADHVTHEVKSPVTAIFAATEMLADSDRLCDSDRHLVAQIEGAAEQIRTQLEALQKATRARTSSHRGLTRLRALEPELIRERPGLAIAIEGGDVAIPLAASGMRIILSQLLRNAEDHGATCVTLAAQESGKTVEVTIADDGSGISPGNQDRVFDPFFTTRRSEGGTGMGLAIARNIIAAHGGTIALSPAGSTVTGACFLICLPRHS